MRRAGGQLVLCLALVVVISALTSCFPERQAGRLERWEQGEEHGPWTVRYDGYGLVEGDEDAVVMEPQAAAGQDITHGGLVHTTAQCTDPDFRVTVNTWSQVRQGTPNPWEVGWVLWDFVDDTHFYAIALKPNGWELTKQDPDYRGSQRFLATGAEPRFPIGRDYEVEVRRRGATMTVHVEGRQLVQFTDEDAPYLGGSVGLYTEDARVRFSGFDLPDCLRP